MRDEYGTTEVAPGKAVSAKLIRPEVPLSIVTLELTEAHAKFLRTLLGYVRITGKQGELSYEIFTALSGAGVTSLYFTLTDSNRGSSINGIVAEGPNE